MRDRQLPLHLNPVQRLNDSMAILAFLCLDIQMLLLNINDEAVVELAIVFLLRLNECIHIPFSLPVHRSELLFAL